MPPVRNASRTTTFLKTRPYTRPATEPPVTFAVTSTLAMMSVIRSPASVSRNCMTTMFVSLVRHWPQKIALSNVRDQVQRAMELIMKVTNRVHLVPRYQQQSLLFLLFFF